MHDPGHLLHGHVQVADVQKSFASENSLPENSIVQGYRVTQWWEMPTVLENLVSSQGLPPGADLKLKHWYTLT